MGWQPRDPTTSDSLDDWRPFLLAARDARHEEVHWPLDPLDFRLIGQVTRKGRGPLWVYVHQRTGGDLNVDEEGRPHRVRLDRAFRLRSKPVTIRTALWITGVPQEELDREPPPHSCGIVDDDWCRACAVAVDFGDAPDEGAPVSTQRPLRLVR